jgi:hypothetical protein
VPDARCLKRKHSERVAGATTRVAIAPTDHAFLRKRSEGAELPRLARPV